LLHADHLLPGGLGPGGHVVALLGECGGLRAGGELLRLRTGEGPGGLGLQRLRLHRRGGGLLAGGGGLLLQDGQRGDDVDPVDTGRLQQRGALQQLGGTVAAHERGGAGGGGALHVAVTGEGGDVAAAGGQVGVGLHGGGRGGVGGRAGGLVGRLGLLVVLQRDLRGLARGGGGGLGLGQLRAEHADLRGRGVAGGLGRGDLGVAGRRGGDARGQPGDDEAGEDRPGRPRTPVARRAMSSARSRAHVRPLPVRPADAGRTCSPGARRGRRSERGSVLPGSRLRGPHPQG
jgi:hypothetical protein